MSSQFHGIHTALITPFSGGEVDFSSLEKLVDFQLKGGVQGLVVNGTTAESPSLNKAEVEKIFKFIRKQAGDDFCLVLGTGSNSTMHTIENTRWAQELGASGALVVVPYYNKPTQEGIEKHFLAVSASVDIPVLLYNVPGRTVVSMDNNVVAKLSDEENIVGIKEASGNAQFPREMKDSVEDDFVLSSGDDESCFEFLQNGGHGVISVMSHILPGKTVEWYKGAISQDTAAAEDFKNHLPLIQGLYSEPNPIGVKWALYKMGIIASPELRLPMTTLGKDNQQALEKLLSQFQLV